VCRGLSGTLPFWLDLSWTTLLSAVVTQRVAREAGLVHGKHPFLFPQGQPVPIGTPGAVSLEGTFLGLGAGVLLALLRALLLPPAPWIGTSIILCAVAAGMTSAGLTAGYFQRTVGAANRSIDLVGSGIAVGISLLCSLLAR
ncbi:MAG: DUF92 domain-containing protein, partial [Deltaproteobacteria bacterium]